MISKLVHYRICLAILVVSLLLQIAGMATEGWVVTDNAVTSETLNMGLYYASYCKDGNCDVIYVEDIPGQGPLNDKSLMIYRVETALAGALTLMAIIFLGRLTTQCCADCQTCASFENHITCIHSFVLAAGLLALSAAGHIANNIGANSSVSDIYEVPYSVILTGIGALFALLVFFFIIIAICRENDSREQVVQPAKKYISPDEYFEKTNMEPYVEKVVEAPVPVAPVPVQQRQVVYKPSPPSYTSSRRTYSDFVSEHPRSNIEYIELPSTSYRQHRQPTQYVHQPRPNVFHVTLSR